MFYFGKDFAIYKAKQIMNAAAMISFVAMFVFVFLYMLIKF